MKHAIGVALVLVGLALWASVPVALAWQGRFLTFHEFVLFVAMLAVLGGVLLAG